MLFWKEYHDFQVLSIWASLRTTVHMCLWLGLHTAYMHYNFIFLPDKWPSIYIDQHFIVYCRNTMDFQVLSIWASLGMMVYSIRFLPALFEILPFRKYPVGSLPLTTVFPQIWAPLAFHYQCSMLPTQEGCFAMLISPLGRACFFSRTWALL